MGSIVYLDHCSRKQHDSCTVYAVFTSYCNLCCHSSMAFIFCLTGFVVLKCLKQLNPFRTVPVTVSTFLLKLVPRRPSQRFCCRCLLAKGEQMLSNVHLERKSSPQKEKLRCHRMPPPPSPWELLVRMFFNFDDKKTHSLTACTG